MWIHISIYLNCIHGNKRSILYVYSSDTNLQFSCTYIQLWTHLIIINVTHISMFRNHSFNFGRNVAKRGRNMERRRERNIAEPKFQLKSFRPSSCVFYGCGRI